MNELDKLINKYQENINQIEENLKLLESNFPKVNIDEDILMQFNIDLLLSLENLLNKLSLTENELNKVKEAFSYYRLNQDLDLTKLIIRDSKCINFIETIVFLCNKVIEYKNNMNNNYQKEIEKLQGIIKPLDTIKGLFQSTSEIDIKNLMTLLSSLEIDKDTLLEVLTDALNHNLEILQKVKDKDEVKESKDNILEDSKTKTIFDSKEIISTQAEESNKNLNKVADDDIEKLDSLENELEQDQSIEEIINDYDRKIEYLLSILLKNPKNQDEIYLIQSRLVELKTNLLTLKEDYELCNSMLQEKNSDEYTYLLETKKEIENSIQTIVEEIDNYAENILETEELEEELPDDKKRNLIFLTSSFKDIENFKKDACQLKVIKKIYSMLKNLKENKILSSVPYIEVGSLYGTINEYKAVITSSGAPRIFYQLIDNNVIIILMGLEGKMAHKSFKTTLESRTTLSLESEYKNIAKVLSLSESKPNEISPYNPNLTNKEYALEVLMKYQESEQEFFEIFHQECYNPDEKKR